MYAKTLTYAHNFFHNWLKWLTVSGRKKSDMFISVLSTTITTTHSHSQLNHMNNYEICCEKCYVSNITVLQNILRWRDANKLKTKNYQYKWSSSNLGKWRLKEIYYRSSFMLDNNRKGPINNLYCTSYKEYYCFKQTRDLWYMYMKSKEPSIFKLWECETKTSSLFGPQTSKPVEPTM